MATRWFPRYTKYTNIQSIQSIQSNKVTNILFVNFLNITVLMHTKSALDPLNRRLYIYLFWTFSSVEIKYCVRYASSYTANVFTELIKKKKSNGSKNRCGDTALCNYYAYVFNFFFFYTSFMRNSAATLAIRRTFKTEKNTNSNTDSIYSTR